MTAKIVQLADAVTAALAEAEFTVQFVPERSYADWTMQLEDTDALHVDVVIVGHEATELDDRGDISYVDAIDIGIRYKFGPEAREPDGRLRNADVDALVALVEEIHLKKTAALIRAAAVMPAIAGGAPAAAREALTRYGELLGLAFQIVDDVLDETSSPEALGKSAHKDRERGKMTCPAAIGLDACMARARDLGARAAAEPPVYLHECPRRRTLADPSRLRAERSHVVHDPAAPVPLPVRPAGPAPAPPWQGARRVRSPG